MQDLFPPLSDEQVATLENDLLQSGCYSPVIVNEDLVIIDGHNRQKLCEQHDIPYKIAVFSFEDLLEAKQWALDTQKGRRNLDKWELGKIALKLKPDLEAKARENMSAGGGDQKSTESGCLNSDNPISDHVSDRVPDRVDTRQQLADTVGIGRDTMSRIMKIDEHAPDVVKEALDKKELSVNQGYNITKQVQNLPEAEQEQAAVKAIEYEKAKKELREKDAEAEHKSKIAKMFCKAYEKAVLISATEENVRYWVESTRMTLEEIDDEIQESRMLAKTFATIADILEQKILPSDWRNPHDEATTDPATES